MSLASFQLVERNCIDANARDQVASETLGYVKPQESKDLSVSHFSQNDLTHKFINAGDA